MQRRQLPSFFFTFIAGAAKGEVEGLITENQLRVNRLFWLIQLFVDGNSDRDEDLEDFDQEEVEVRNPTPSFENQRSM